jgi:protein-tyrosine kinase
MDTVEKALLKARQESSPRSGLATFGNKPYREKSIHDRARLAPASRRPATTSNIVYQKTSVQPISDKVLRKNRLLAGFHTEPVSDTYRMLRVQVLQQLGKQGGSTLAVCSANAGEGKTLTASNLAISIALDSNHTALLVDLDLRRPRLHQYFGIEVKRGLCDYLEGNAELEDCMVNPGIERLVLLPVRRSVLNSSELLSSSCITDLLVELRSRYPDRIVIYDLPPLLTSDDSLVILPNVDASLLVVREGKTRSGEIQRGTRMLQDYRLIGTVLNASTEGNINPYY